MYSPYDDSDSSVESQILLMLGAVTIIKNVSFYYSISGIRTQRRIGKYAMWACIPLRLFTGIGFTNEAQQRVSKTNLKFKPKFEESLGSWVFISAPTCSTSTQATKRIHHAP
ncbi:hypothetical protein HID58_052124 [Brassica napus]|uniref:Uncharacterized protein n=1 Tax=Brassica napus TaxID=3708 RepID=A0ABQ8AAX4_BRANA|nr:hypothetical protein HID58_052124 [Brassica napus]